MLKASETRNCKRSSASDEVIDLTSDDAQDAPEQPPRKRSRNTLQECMADANNGGSAANQDRANGASAAIDDKQAAHMDLTDPDYQLELALHLSLTGTARDSLPGSGLGGGASLPCLRESTLSPLRQGYLSGVPLRQGRLLPRAREARGTASLPCLREATLAATQASRAATLAAAQSSRAATLAAAQASKQAATIPPANRATKPDVAAAGVAAEVLERSVAASSSVPSSWSGAGACRVPLAKTSQEFKSVFAAFHLKCEKDKYEILSIEVRTLSPLRHTGVPRS